MTPESMSKITTILEHLPHQNGLPMDDNITGLYMIGLEDLPDRIVPSLVRRILHHCRWRPTVAEIRGIASDLLTDRSGKTPNQVVNEIAHALRVYGEYGRPITSHPNIYERGVPVLSPEALEAVEELGGWFALCEKTYTSESVWDAQLYRTCQDVLKRRQAEGRTLAIREAGKSDG